MDTIVVVPGRPLGVREDQPGVVLDGRARPDGDPALPGVRASRRGRRNPSGGSSDPIPVEVMLTDGSMNVAEASRKPLPAARPACSAGPANRPARLGQDRPASSAGQGGVAAHHQPGFQPLIRSAGTIVIPAESCEFMARSLPRDESPLRPGWEVVREGWCRACEAHPDRAWGASQARHHPTRTRPTGLDPNRPVIYPALGFTKRTAWQQYLRISRARPNENPERVERDGDCSAKNRRRRATQTAPSTLANGPGFSFSVDVARVEVSLGRDAERPPR